MTLLNDVIKLQVCFSKILAEPLLGPPKFYTNWHTCSGQ